MYVYVITNDKKRIYVGMSKDPKNRLIEHNAGKTKSTKGFRPWKLMYIQECKDRVEGRKLEKNLKSGSKKEELKKMLKCPCSSDG
ncbi:MAG: GIY-YIG nuclease family protein [bacterium]|nr:GIY-YIG nuclease family protein [bacterium]